MANELLKKMGSRIALIRQQHKMTQADLAGYLDVSPKHISHIERGSVGISSKALFNLCNLFQCDINYIIYGKDSNDVLSLLPEGIVDILHTGSDKELALLQKYLDMYLILRKQ